jgi:hypothetical protein
MYQLPKLPPRKLIGAHSVPFVEERQRSLQTYLVALVATPGVVVQPAFVQFLLPGISTAAMPLSRASSSRSVSANADRVRGGDSSVDELTAATVRLLSSDSVDSAGGKVDVVASRGVDTSVHRLDTSGSGSSVGGSGGGRHRDDSTGVMLRSASAMSLNSYDSLPVSTVGSPAAHGDWPGFGAHLLDHGASPHRVEQHSMHHSHHGGGSDRVLWPATSPTSLQSPQSSRAPPAPGFGLAFMFGGSGASGGAIGGGGSVASPSTPVSGGKDAGALDPLGASSPAVSVSHPCSW